MSLRTARCATGFTLIELMVCIGIIMVLAGIVYVNLGPVRERARETRCLNNFRQIGLALQMKRGAPAPMYRQDYGGSDPPGATTVVALGLPYGPPTIALRSYVRSPDVFHCRSVYWPPDVGRTDAPDHLRLDYFWSAIPDELTLRAPDKQVRGRLFSALVARRGQDAPLLSDPHHGTHLRPVVPKPKTYLVLVLRLGGQVQRVMTDAGDGWEW